MKSSKVQPEAINQDFVNNITTVVGTKESPAYLVDKRLLDNILSKITTGNLNDIKNDLRDIISYAKDKDSMFKDLDDYIYLNTVVAKITAIEDMEKENEEVTFESVTDTPVKIHAQTPTYVAENH